MRTPRPSLVVIVVVVAAALAAASLVPLAASAYSVNLAQDGSPIRWNKLPVAWTLHPAGSADISNGSDIAAVKASFQDWQKISCSGLTFEFKGDTFTTQVLPTGGSPNGKNELVWAEGDEWPFGSHVLGVTSPIYGWDGVIVEADIAFNGKQVSWSTDGKWNTADVKSVAIHEIGHFFGAQHVLGGFDPWDPPTMAPTADPYGKTASLTSDDQQVACYLYPTSGTYGCSQNSQCPYAVEKNPDTDEEYYIAKAKCQGGKCVFGEIDTGGKGLGEACAGEGECKSPAFCQPLLSGEQLCASYCVKDVSECPPGFMCSTYPGGNSGACLPDDLVASDNGDYCASNQQCKSKLCYPSPDGNWKCRQPCETEGQCPAGEACFFALGYDSGGCLSKDRIPDYKVQDGDPCNAGEDCSSGVCVLNPGTAGPRFCRSACQPGEACGLGYACLGADGVWACIPNAAPTTKKADGEPCSSGAECEAGTCHGGTCKTACNVVSPTCPDAEAHACRRTTLDAVGGVCEARGGLLLGSDCKNDQACSSLFCEVVKEGENPQCLLPCFAADGSCGGDRTCEILQALTTLGACLDPGGEVPVGTDGTDGADGSNDPDSGSSSSSSETGGKKGSGGAPACSASERSTPATGLLLIPLLLGLGLSRRRRNE